jgi:hypothetical protein
MNQRVIVGIERHVDWPRLKAALLHAGAHSLSEPTSYQPDAVVATLGKDSDAAAYIKNVQALPGVRYAEPDAMSGTL